MDPSSGEADDEGVSDEYPLEPVALTPADFVRPSPFPDPKASWEQLGAEGEVTEKFVLSFPSIADAVEGVVKHLGMVPLLGTGVVPDDATAHRLILSGSFLGEHDVVARAQLQKASAESVVLMVRAPPSPTRARVYASSSLPLHPPHSPALSLPALHRSSSAAPTATCLSCSPTASAKGARRSLSGSDDRLCCVSAL